MKFRSSVLLVLVIPGIVSIRIWVAVAVAIAVAPGVASVRAGVVGGAAAVVRSISSLSTNNSEGYRESGLHFISFLFYFVKYQMAWLFLYEFHTVREPFGLTICYMKN